MAKLNLAEIQQIDLPDPTPTDGDGDDGNSDLRVVTIEVAINGYMVTFSFDDGDEEKYTFTDFDEVLKCIKSKH